VMSLALGCRNLCEDQPYCNHTSPGTQKLWFPGGDFDDDDDDDDEFWSIGSIVAM